MFVTLGGVDLVRFGRGIRALRVRRRWRQIDLAEAAGVSQTVVTRIERGVGDTVPLRKLGRDAAALGARVHMRLNYNGQALDRHRDAAHAQLVELVPGFPLPWGWEVLVEATFSIFGERGSVDILAWHLESRSALIVEVKFGGARRSIDARVDRSEATTGPEDRRRSWLVAGGDRHAARGRDEPDLAPARRGAFRHLRAGIPRSCCCSSTLVGGAAGIAALTGALVRVIWSAGDWSSPRCGGSTWLEANAALGARRGSRQYVSRSHEVTT